MKREDRKGEGGGGGEEAAIVGPDELRGRGGNRGGEEAATVGPDELSKEAKTYKKKAGEHKTNLGTALQVLSLPSSFLSSLF